MKLQKHHSDHLDGTKGRWRPALVAGLLGVDGHPMTFEEVVVISCPGCGAPQGIGGDDVKIVDGKTDRPWRCYDPRCQYVVDSMEFLLHQDPKGREHFAQLKDQASKEVDEGRVRHLHERIRQELQDGLNDRALSEARKIMAAGGAPPQELFRNAMGRKKLLE